MQVWTLPCSIYNSNDMCLTLWQVPDIPCCSQIAPSLICFFFLVGLKWWMKRNCTLTVTPIHWSHHTNPTLFPSHPIKPLLDFSLLTTSHWFVLDDPSQCSIKFVCVFQVCEVSAESQVRYELETRFQQLQSRLAAVTLETEEVR